MYNMLILFVHSQYIATNLVILINTHKHTHACMHAHVHS